MTFASQVKRASTTKQNTAGSIPSGNEEIHPLSLWAGERIFADNGLTISKHDLSVMPLIGKVPAISGFNRWRAGPTEQTVRKWAERYPDLNIGIHTRSSVLAILDGDDAATFARIMECVGDTPLRTLTRRGGHSYFRLSRDSKTRNLRQFGINGDLKGPAQNDYVVAPPSAHPEDREFRYALDKGCDWTARYHLPTLTNAAIDNLVEHLAGSHQKADRIRQEFSGARRRSRMNGPIPEGERANTLKDRLCREVAHCDDFRSLLDCAYTINDDCVSSLGENEIIRVAGRIWSDYQDGKLGHWRGRAGRAQTTLSEIHAFSVHGSTGAFGHMLLEVLKINHMARVQRGGLFAIYAEGMAQAQVIPGWNRDNYRRATKALVETGAIRFVKWGKIDNMKSDGKLYTFGPLVLREARR